MKAYLFLAYILLCLANAQAQVDTLRPGTSMLNTAALFDRKSTYAVFFEDSTGRRLSSADLWDRSIQRTQQNKQEQVSFRWNWYNKDTLMAEVSSTNAWPTLAPLTHIADYKKRGMRQYIFENDVVTIPAAARKTAKDSTFRVTMNPTAFSFPMDMELFALLPFKKVGQRFAMAFYEPGSPKSAYYSLTVTGRERLPIAGGTTIDCWLLRIDYRADSYATFWISDRPREVVKMKEYFRGRYRYKVKLY